ncbi:MAG: uncharacterized protein KVP18_002735 [Porospora cf. gigantea A]|uniref:uncharacterized protein n=1 Tax=Porospora cf. gigantea A TaxID=2853593 RepID=UPI00355AA88E|nr:MAG: hypothetical protein KVP18_002735 [Porospora cf. gigantea A]
MVYLTLYINNKHGGLVYVKDFLAPTNLTSNERIILASTFHGMCGVASQVSPLRKPHGWKPGSGNFAGLLEPNSLTCIETADFVLHAYETPTGVRFFATASLGEVKVGEFLRAASSVYSDLILKNPFFEEDMPIRSPEFDKALQETCSRIIMK